MRGFIEWLDWWKWWIIVPLIILAIFIGVFIMIGEASKDYVKCREAHKPVDICVVGG